MNYTSSRNTKLHVPSHKAIIQGLSSEGGLFTPESIPAFSLEDLQDCSYQKLAERILSGFLPDFSKGDIHTAVYGAYDSKFDDERIVPLRKIPQGYLMDLWHGPTSAFKDIALTILPRLLTTACRMENNTDVISILTATSGDTGKAALEGFKDVPGTAITVFYPEIGVSTIQKRQMSTTTGKNVEVIALKGNFDDCQRIVKQATQDKKVLDSLDGVSISSANSINVGRLVPQIVYYYSSYLQLVKDKEIVLGDEVSFIVPTGNFGDILAGYLAKESGLPVKKLICASNSNNVLTDFLQTGTYSIAREFKTTMSPSMDILISSNLERLLFMMSGYDDAFVMDCMEKLQKENSYTIPSFLLEKIQEVFAGYWTDEEECAKTIYDTYKESNVLIDPHTSVALSVCKKYQSEGNNEPCIILSTASPYKFSKDVLKALHVESEDGFEAMHTLHKMTDVPVPANLQALESLPVRFTRSIEKSQAMDVIAERMKEIGNDHH